MARKSLAQSIQDFLAKSGKAVAEIMWVGSHDGVYGMAWDAFAAGPGAEPVPMRGDMSLGARSGRYVGWTSTDLVVVGDGWWLVRLTQTVNSYQLIQPPTYNPEAKPYVTAVSDGKHKGPLHRAKKHRRILTAMQSVKASIPSRPSYEGEDFP